LNLEKGEVVPAS